MYMTETLSLSKNRIVKIRGRSTEGGQGGQLPPPPLSFYLYENVFEN